MKSQRMRWVGHATCMEEIIIYTKCSSENLKGRDHFENTVINRKIILEWILGK
jgi:SPX domain protein involved in polyphosphate accumulation